jgi:pyridoxine 4-dehydrogenase
MQNECLLGGDLRIRRLGFGAMRLPTATWQGPPRDPETGRAVLRRAVELGVNHIDTAAYYRSNDGSVRANALIREALHPYPPGLVIATKLGPVFGPKGAREAPASELRAHVEENLQTLGLDRLDLVYLRISGWGDVASGSIAKRFEALARLREEGLIRHLGISNATAAHLAEARAIAPVAALQNRFDDESMLDVCTEAGIAFVPFGPLGNEGVPARKGATPAQAAIAWTLARSPVTLAIPGTGSIAHLEENMAAIDLV